MTSPTPKRLKYKIYIFLAILIVVLIFDQFLKYEILRLAFHKYGTINIDSISYLFRSEIIDIALVFNKGVAFSFLAFLGDNLKYIQLFLILIIIIFFIQQRRFFEEYFIGFGFIFGGGISNIIDRFLYKGVVDYIYWHYQFNFAIFNLADMSINLGIIIMIITMLIKRKNAR
ncbi:signal peptidase II [Helicobacter sp. 11S02629-2]|uniref:signal peptidase II n=1 Tax=Helicobacter sp. 11S02629-2 TaxID=1476195 RepID=UPI0015DA6D3E|nr:signal peptidase II [Helicobacter sp. 11S02629-2]